MPHGTISGRVIFTKCRIRNAWTWTEREMERLDRIRFKGFLSADLTKELCGARNHLDNALRRLKEANEDFALALDALNYIDSKISKDAA